MRRPGELSRMTVAGHVLDAEVLNCIAAVWHLLGIALPQPVGWWGLGPVPAAVWHMLGIALSQLVCLGGFGLVTAAGWPAAGWQGLCSTRPLCGLPLGGMG